MTKYVIFSVFLWFPTETSAEPNTFDFRDWIDHKEIEKMSLPSGFEVQDVEVNNARYLQVSNHTGSLLLEKKPVYQTEDFKNGYCGTEATANGTVSIKISGTSTPSLDAVLKHLELITKEIVRKCMPPRST